MIAEVGVGRTTHRAVAERAGLPLGATTYYFPTLGDLVAAGLRHAADEVRADLAAWGDALAGAHDPAAVLAGLVAGHLADRPKALLEYDLYVAAARDPALRPPARAWLDGFAALLEPRYGGPAARAVVALADGALLQALVTGGDVDEAALAAGIGRLTG